MNPAASALVPTRRPLCGRSNQRIAGLSDAPSAPAGRLRVRPQCRTAWLARLLALLAISAGSAAAAGWSEEFSSHPLARGWRVAGDPSLFTWDSASECLAVTWDSSRSNSYFLRPIGTVLSRTDDFSFSFDLRLKDTTIGVNTNRPFTFQIAVGLIRLISATDPNLQRGSGVNAAHGPRNLAEFTWFPDSGFGATVSPSILSSNNQPAFAFAFPFELDPGALFGVQLSYAASNQTLRTTMTRNGEAFGPVGSVVLGAGFTDFRLDHFAISSYSDEGADGSILAHGTVDNLSVTVPDPAIGEPADAPFGALSNGVWTASILSQWGFEYELERSTDLADWTTVAGPMSGTGGSLALPDNSPPITGAFYRVKADKP